MCGNNPSVTGAVAVQMARDLKTLQDYAAIPRPGPADWQIAARVRQIWASPLWAEYQRVNPGLSDLDLLDAIVRYGSLWDVVTSPEIFPLGG